MNGGNCLGPDGSVGNRKDIGTNSATRAEEDVAGKDPPVDTSCAEDDVAWKGLEDGEARSAPRVEEDAAGKDPPVDAPCAEDDVVWKGLEDVETGSAPCAEDDIAVGIDFPQD